VITDSPVAGLQARVALQAINRHQVNDVTEQAVTRTEEARTTDTAAAAVVQPEIV
jgi:hypothetical protein